MEQKEKVSNLIDAEDYNVEEGEAIKNAWFETYTGRKFHAFDPQPEDIDIRDIGHALALTCRYGGQCQFFYSVAQHSVHCAEVAESDTFTFGDIALWCLMHDAAEAYIGDMPKPFKPFMKNFDVVEERIMEVIADKFGLKWPMPEKVHEIDRLMLNTEARQLLPGCSWASGAAIPGFKIQHVGPEGAEAMFHSAFSELYFRGV